MIELALNNARTCITGADQDVLRELSLEMSFRKAGFQHSKMHSEGKWDGRTRLMTTNYFPTGLISIALKWLKANGYEYYIKDCREVPDREPIEVRWIFPHKLRYFQEEATEVFLKAGRGSVVLPTASGKTIFAAKVIFELKVRALFLVHTQEARKDTIKDLKASLKGDIGEGYRDITVSTIQAFTNPKSKKFPDLSYWDFIIFDEVHHMGATSYFPLYKFDAYYRLGLTGTFTRTDGAAMKLLGVSGKVLYQKKPSDLVKEGYLAKPTITWVKYVTRINPYSNYHEANIEGIVENDDRNEKVVEHIIARKGKSILVVVEKIEHGERILELLRQKGHNAVFVSGKSKDRAKCQEEFQEGLLKVLIATKIYDESVNIPKLDVVVMAAGGKSPIKTLQRIGRALRIAEGKDSAEYVDFEDVFHHTLEEHYMARRATLNKFYNLG